MTVKEFKEQLEKFDEEKELSVVMLDITGGEVRRGYSIEEGTIIIGGEKALIVFEGEEMEKKK